jgi:hypothetical protein
MQTNGPASGIYIKQVTCGWGVHYAGTILRIEKTQAQALACARIYAKHFG